MDMRDYEFYYTQDGSVGLYSYADDDVYHSKYGALTEAWQKFILPSGVESLLNTKKNIRVLDLCYGVGYNTKALMSYIINSDENLLKKYYKNNLKNNLKKYFKNIGKNLREDINIVSIDNDNIKYKVAKLLSSIETIDNCMISNINIDCLDINDELIKISPFLKTLITPQEIYTKIIPSFFDCLDLYWKIKKLIAKTSMFFLPKNKDKITEKLNLKYNNDYDELEKEHRIHKFVNVILIDRLLDKYGEHYINEKIKNIIKEKENRPYFDKSLFKYASLKQKIRYNFMSRINLLTNLHNIYYNHLSKRYKNAKFEHVDKLFNIRFFVNDARKTILTLDGQYDFIFLDAFTYSKAPELWSTEFIAELYSKLNSRGFLLTYSNSAMVRNTLLENNFYVGKIIDEKTGKFIGTIACKEKTLIKYPLDNYELGLCATKAGIPYHDPGLSWSREMIRDKREFDFKNSDLLTSTQYIKRRTMKCEDEDESEE